MTQKERTGIILVLGALSALGPFSIDMYLPGFAAIAADMKTSVSVIGYSLTSYFIGISFGQLIYGPVTDRYGRKKPLLIGLSVYLGASIACAVSPTVVWLVTSRFLMALGACVGLVASRAMVRDLFPVRETAGVFSTFMLIIAVSPMLAPTIGGYVTANLGWRIIFVVLMLFSGALILTIARFLPESSKPDHSVSLKPGGMFTQYLAVARNHQFRVYAILGGLESAGLFAYISGSSFVFMKLFGLSQTQFGWTFSLNAVGLIAGSQINRLLLRRFSSHQLVAACVSGQLLLGVLLVATSVFPVHLIIMIVMIMTFLFCTGVVNPNAAALGLEPFTANAGSASALLGSIQMAVGALSSGIVSSLAHASAFPMTATMLATAIAGCLILLQLRRRKKSARYVGKQVS